MVNQQALLATAQQAQIDSQFFGLLTTTYQDLIPIAAGLQRVADPEAQTAILDAVRAGLNGQVTQAAAAQVAQQFAGATLAAAPLTLGQAGQPPLPSYAEVMTKVMDDDLAKRDPVEYQKWYEIYNNHPNMGAASLGMGEFRDPFANPYHTRQQAAGIQPRGADTSGRRGWRQLGSVSLWRRPRFSRRIGRGRWR